MAGCDWDKKRNKYAWLDGCEWDKKRNKYAWLDGCEWVKKRNKYAWLDVSWIRNVFAWLFTLV